MKNTREMIEVMEAYERGEEIEIKISGVSWERCQSPLWTWGPCDYRIKPKAQYRPWKPEEVPVGCLIRGDWGTAVLTHIENCGTHWVVGCPDTSEHGRQWSLNTALASNIKHSTDGGKTWKICGVEVKL